MNSLIKNTGFTLVELVVAILIFSIGILGVAKMQSEAIKGNSFSMQTTRAVNLASDTAEMLSGLDMTATTMLDVGGPYTDANNPEISWTVVPQGPDERQVTINVQWQDTDRTHNLNLTLIRGRI